MIKLFRFLLILLLLGALVQTSSFVSATDNLSLLDEEDEEDKKAEEDEEDEEDSEEEKDEKEDAYGREIELTEDSDKFEVKSVLKLGESKDEIKIEFKAEDEAEFTLKYKSESDVQEFEFKYRVTFEKIVEYWDVGSSGFQEGMDELSTLEFTSWDPITYETVDINGVQVYEITATTSDHVFSLVLRLSASILNVGEATLTPNSIKIDVIISEYEYTYSNSSLALKTKIKTESEIEEQEDSTEELAGLAQSETQIAIGTLSQGFFSWANNATADGAVIDVLTSTILDSSDEDDDLDSGETSQKLYYSFIVTNAAKIIWDPKIGVVSEGTQALIESIESRYGNLGGANSPLPGFGFWIIFLSLSVMSLIRLRKRRVR